jgi:tetratricopeptide (TPR) repeat protein
MIVKNEEHNLPDCLAAVAGLVDEIVVVDTGSSDRTREMAGRLGARVFDFPWVDDFAAARNESRRHATGDWIFWLDADDRVDEVNRSRLRTLFSAPPEEDRACSMRTEVLLPSGSTTAMDHVRLFRNDPRICWKYRVHEQLLFGTAWLADSARKTDVVIQHLGYQDGAVMMRKGERNLRMLEMDHRDDPGDPVVCFNLGWTYLGLGRFADALPCLQRSLQRSAPTLSIVRRLYPLLVKAHRELGQYQQAATICAEGRKRYPDDRDLLAQDERLRAVLAQLFVQARDFHRAGAFERAEALYRQVLVADPGQVQTLYLLGAACDAQGKVDEAEASLRQAVQLAPDNADAHNHLGVVLARKGRLEEAVANFQQALRLRPRFADAQKNLRLALGERDGAAP